VRFLFLTLYGIETDFYGRVSTRLRELGHDSVHVTWSAPGARALRRRGLTAHVLPDLLAAAGDVDLAAEGSRIEATYDILSLRDVYRTDWACVGRPEADCLERTVRHFVALERVFDDVHPDVVVPEVGGESIRTAGHALAAHRGIEVLFPFYTIFPRPLRLYANTVHAPIVASEDVRALNDDERAEVEAFVGGYIVRDRPTLPHRRPRVRRETLRDFARHVWNAAGPDRANEYLRPHRFVTNYVRLRTRARLARPLYRQMGELRRPFVYFPLHVTQDYKIQRVIPHLQDQAAIIELIATGLPQGYDLVLKEHPVSVGANPVGFLRRLQRHPNVHLVDPHASSHELIRRSAAVAVISSTVGLEALLHGKGVLTFGRPFYAGFGLTVEVDALEDALQAVHDVLRFEPDRERTLRFLHAAMRRCWPGAPPGVDASDANARTVAETLDAAVRPPAPYPAPA
jgi:Capsule polysaccharide biosynthesis protein